MTHIWKCAFCNVKEMQMGTLNKHERDCRLNPKNKLCFTCKKFTPGSKVCEERIKVFNVQTSGIPCDKWIQKISISI